jgi:hypothetical protein
MFFITEMKSVYSAVRTGSLNKIGLRFVCKGLIHIPIVGECRRFGEQQTQLIGTLRQIQSYTVIGKT